MVNKIKSQFSLEWAVAFCTILIFVGFVTSRALISIGMISLIGFVIIFGQWKNTISLYFNNKALLFLSFPFFILLLSGLWSDNTTEWLGWTRIKLPWLLLPFAFAGVSNFTTRQFIVLMYAFVLSICGSTFIILANYIVHFDTINQSFLSGGGIPVPFSHIRHTLMLSYAFFICLYLYQSKMRLYFKWEKYVQLIFSAFAFVALHILSVRSGLLALYLGLLTLVILYIVQNRKFLGGFFLVIIAFSTAYLAILYIPSLQNKLKYMQYDLDQYKQGKFADTNDGVRLVSMQIGFDVWKDNKLLGAGAGDLKEECLKLFSIQYPNLNDFSKKLPHNQFIWTLASTGIVGLLLLMIALATPFCSPAINKNWLFLIFYLMIFSSLFFEHTFEEQIGTGYFITMLLVLMKHLTIPVSKE